MVYRPGIDKDRRKGPDPLVKTMTWLSALCWGMLFFGILLLDQAQPKLLTAETQWNEQILSLLYYLLLITFSIALVGLMINRKRHRRKGDMYRISLVLNFLISMAGLVILLFS